MTKIEKDEYTGVETTGHEWDGIRELNLPAPRWWLIVFAITVVWGFGYMVLYPAWPTLSGEGERGGTAGTLGWTQYKALEDSQKVILERRAEYAARFEKADYRTIQNDEALYAFGLAGGKSAFKDNCATCHGTGGAGAPGYPNLNDDDWLWGGSIEAIEQTVRFGVRTAHDETRFSEMPGFAGLVSDEEIGAMADHVLSLSGKADANPAGADLFEAQCSFCHGVAGEGLREVGAPNLGDAIWFYGESRAEIIAQIRNPKHGEMPAWIDRLDDQTIRQLSLYVHSLGGGEASPDMEDVSVAP